MRSSYDELLNPLIFDPPAPGTEHVVLRDWTVRGFRVVVMSDDCRNIFAYIGVPEDHVLAGIPCAEFPLAYRWHLTFSGKAGTGKLVPEIKGYYWHGRDFGGPHDLPEPPACPSENWLVEEVTRQATQMVEDFIRLAEFAEGVFKDGQDSVRQGG